MKPATTLTVLIVLAAVTASAQELAQPSGQKTLAATMNVFVFPAEGQAPEQQSKDEVECYNWAVANTGSDPFELVKKAEEAEKQAQQQQAQVSQATQGAGARGAVGGAAAGALIGEIASNDAGSGAAWGAAIGGISARRRARAAEEQASRQIEQQKQQTQQASAEAIGNFKKAFSVCLEAKDYLVKY